MRIIRILEVSWLVIAFAGLLITGYMLIKGRNNDALYFIIFTLFAAIFYFVRRKQRIKIQNEQKK